MAEVSPLSCNTRKIRAEQIEQRSNIVIIPAKSEKKPNSDKSVITKNINTTKIIFFKIFIIFLPNYSINKIINNKFIITF